MDRAVDAYWVTVRRTLVEDMLRVAELVVCVISVAGVEVIGRSESGVLSGKSLENS